MVVLLAFLLAQEPPALEVVVVRCEVLRDAHARVYELRRGGGVDAPSWTLLMRSREAGASPVRLPLPDAVPEVAAGRVTLDYQTLNGGRDVHWRVSPDGAVLDLHANFELEVNIEPDLDPRVELMNTDGPLSALACTVPAPPR